ncbi:MAG: SDR family NAD(P)-dependent oxidoreductase [Nanoarchaeota archaeon]
MNIVVTGGAGFIGSHVCERLLERGDTVIIVDDLNAYYDPQLKQRNLDEVRKKGECTFYKVDITDFNALGKVFQENKVDKVIHLAARAGVRASLEQPQLYFNVNCFGTVNVLELCRLHAVKNLVFGSSSSVYGENKKIPFSEEDRVEDQVSPYAVSKRIGELICFSYHSFYKMKVTCLRFFTVYGPRGRPDMAPLKFTTRISEGKPIEMYGDGSSKRDYTFVADIVDGILSALDKDLDFEIINLGDSNPVELTYFISLIEENIGKKAVITQKPMQPGDVPLTYADIAKAKQLLGYTPKVRIEEGIKRMVAWYVKTS